MALHLYQLRQRTTHKELILYGQCITVLLPIASPNPADGLRQSQLAMGERTVWKPPMVFLPGRFIGVLIEVLRAGMVMLAHYHPAKAG
jgi:hypothetical protein